MAQQIQDLVASIRKDGIEDAQAEAKAIVDAAKKEAELLLSKARKDAEALLAKAERDIATRESSARSSLQQASRDVQISLKAAIVAQLDRLLADSVKKAFSSAELISLIKAVVTAVGDEKSKILEVNAAQLEKLAEKLKGELAAELKGGLEIRPSERVDGGFKLMEKDGTSFFDFTAGEVALLLKPYLSHAIEALIFE